jgi:hypothetical protein
MLPPVEPVDYRRSQPATAYPYIGTYAPPEGGTPYTNLLRSTAASTKLANSGCGANGRDFSSG